MRNLLRFTLSLMAMLMVTLNANADELFKSSTPASGTTVTELSEIFLEYASGQSASSNGTYFWIQGPDGEHQVTPVLESSGVRFTVSPKLTLEGSYSLSVGTSFSCKFYDGLGFTFDPQTFTWTIGSGSQGGGSQGGGSQGGGSTEPEYTFEYTGTMWMLTWPSNYSISPNNPNVKIEGYEGQLNVMITDPDFDWNSNRIQASVTLDDGDYTLKIGADSYYINGNLNPEISIPFTVGNPNPPTPTTKDYTVTYDKVNGVVYVTWPEGTTIAKTGDDIHPTIDGEEPDFADIEGNVMSLNITLSDGEHTLAFPANDFTIDGTLNEAISKTFTVGNNHQFTEEPFHETIFKSGEIVPTIPFVVNNDNVNITTEGRPFLDTTIDVGYNMNTEKELNWKSGTKFIIAAKKDINKVIFVPTNDSKNAIKKASAEGGDGKYTNGIWEGKLAAGETLTLTSNDGINIKEFYICYNGDDFDPTTGGGDEKGVITIQYPAENQLIDKQVDGGKFCVFTTNKEYAQVTIEVRNSNEAYDNLFKFPTRMVDNMGENSDNLHVGENTIYAATPASGASGKGDDWYWFKGDSYTMIVKGYVNPWDDPEDYDAIAEVHFVGNGKEHEAESLVKLLNITPATSMENPGQIAMVNGVITLEFDGPVSSVTAVTPQGMNGELSHTATAKAGRENKVWEINLGDQSGFASEETEGDPIIEIDVTAKDADGAVVIFSNDRADRGLVLNYALSGESNPNTETVTLGTPVWSIAQDAEIEASTSSINIKFPNATNVEGTYTLEVAGTIATMDMSEIKQVSGTGTMANGVDLNVSLSENVGYGLVIGTITIKNNGITVYNTSNGNYELNFGTKAAQGGGTGTNILGAAEFSADENGITVSWPNANLEGTNADYVAFQEWTFTVNDKNYTYQPDNLEDFANGINVNIPYEKIAVYDPTIGEGGAYVPAEPKAGDIITVTIPAGAIAVDAGWTNVYTNESAITGTVTVPAPQPTEITFYEFESGKTKTTVDGTTMSYSNGGVTMNITSTTKFAVATESTNYGGGIRTGSTNTYTFTSEKNIVKIEFVTPTGQSWGAPSNVAPGAFNDNVWTGESKTVSFKSPINLTVSKIIITFQGEDNSPKFTETDAISFEAKNEAGYWATYFNSEDVFIEQTATVYTVNANDKLEMNPLQTSSVEAVNATGTFVPANNAVLLFVDKDTYETDGNVSAWTVKNVDINPLTNNDLYPASKNKSELSGYWFYKLAYNYYTDKTGLGFYWGADDGAAFTSTKAYLAVPQSVNARSFYIFDDSETTGIDNINANVYVNGAYNMAGQRVAGSQKGIMIINGKKVIK